MHAWRVWKYVEKNVLQPLLHFLVLLLSFYFHSFPTKQLLTHTWISFYMLICFYNEKQQHFKALLNKVSFERTLFSIKKSKGRGRRWLIPWEYNSTQWQVLSLLDTMWNRYFLRFVQFSQQPTVCQALLLLLLFIR